MRRILTESVETEPVENTSAVRLKFTIMTLVGSAPLWFQVEDEFSQYLTTDRADAALVAVLPMALREG